MTFVSSNAALLGADTHPAIFAAVIEKTNMSSCTEYLFKKKNCYSSMSWPLMGLLQNMPVNLAHSVSARHNNPFQNWAQ